MSAAQNATIVLENENFVLKIDTHSIVRGKERHKEDGWKKKWNERKCVYILSPHVSIVLGNLSTRIVNVIISTVIIIIMMMMLLLLFVCLCVMYVCVCFSANQSSQSLISTDCIEFEIKFKINKKKKRETRERARENQSHRRRLLKKIYFCIFLRQLDFILYSWRHGVVGAEWLFFRLLHFP